MVTMTATQSEDLGRFALITAGHHFLLNVVPFREPESTDALATFAAMVAQSRESSADIDAILLRCLASLDRHGERRIPSLVDRYIASATIPNRATIAFTECVQDTLRYNCITDGLVQHAIDAINTHYTESSLGPHTIAKALGVRLSTLDVSFKRQMSRTLTEYIRGRRLERAAVSLVTSRQSVKEIWADVGYNHPSNFNHDFRRHFGKSPREFRADSIRPVAQRHFVSMRSSGPGRVAAPQSKRLLVVDDDECTRWALSTYLGRQGYSVTTAATGGDGLNQLGQGPIDAILLDYRLGDMDGLDFLRVLRRKTPGSIPAVALFTADWTLFDLWNDVNALGAVIASKLCGLEQVSQLVASMIARTGAMSGRQA